MSVKVPEPLAIIIRKQALTVLSLKTATLLATMEQDAYYDEDADFVVLGPLWPEAADEFIRRLNGLGLEYFDDFFEIRFDKPDWMQLLCAEMKAPLLSE